MPKLPVLSPRKLIRIMQKHGFYVHHQSGSHINLRHVSNKMLHVVIPYHNRDLAPKTLQSILLQADLTIEDIQK